MAAIAINMTGIYNILIEDGIIVSVDTKEATADEVIDATGCYVMPGLVDLHVHLRDPGRCDKCIYNA